MYRLLVETLLGVNLEGDRLRLTPRLPAAWPEVTIHYRFRQTNYHIQIRQLPSTPGSVPQLFLDGIKIVGTLLPLVDDRRDHAVTLNIWAAPGAKQG
jgi:cellobiose phosphorylase